MPYKDPEKRREQKRRWYHANKQKHRDCVKKWRKENPDKWRSYQKKSYEKNKEYRIKMQLEWQQRNRKKMLEHSRIRDTRDCEELSDRYIKKALRSSDVPSECMTNEIIETKRNIIKLKRTIKDSE